MGDDWVLDVEVTTNRPDCLNHYGVARELATLYRQPLKKVEIAVKESGRPAKDVVSIEISDPDLCARYCGRVVQNVKVGPSPDWLVKRLEAVGQRSINNVADATNYVLMELGHPLHAFDLSRLKQHKIIVRRAKTGEPLRTLDGNDHTLTRTTWLSPMARIPLRLPASWAGRNRKFLSSTRDVLLESAWFDPVSIRRTSKSQGFHTEASHRFERGADIQMAPLALDRTAALIQRIAGGEILQGMIDVYPRPPLVQSILFRRSEISRILGAEVAPEEVERILNGLGFVVEASNGIVWVVTAPSFRVDVSREVDLVEEVTRHVGYDQLPSRVRPAPPRVEKDVTREKVISTSSLLVSLGFHEIITTSMVDPAEGEKFSASTPVILENPLSQDASAMRASAVPSMLRAIRWNLDRDTNDAKLFELGKTYSMGANGVPEEHRVLTLGSTGNRRAASLYDNEASLDFFDLKGELEAILGAFEIPKLAFEPSGPAYLQPGQCGRLRSGEIELAVMGQIHQDVARDYKLRQPVWVAEINFERVLQFPLHTKKFQPISKFPAVERDFSLVVPDEVPYVKITSAVSGLRINEIWGFLAVDRFRGGSIPAGHYSLLLRVTFQSQARTLTGDEIEEFSQRLLTALQRLGINLRAQATPGLDSMTPRSR